MNSNSPRSVIRSRLCWLIAAAYSAYSFGIVLHDRVLQLDDRLRIPEMLLAVEPELILAAEIEFQRAGRRRLESGPVPIQGFAGDHVAGRQPLMRDGVPVKYLSITSRLSPTASNCWAAVVAAEGRNAHLRDRLEDALLHGRDVLIGRAGRWARPAGKSPSAWSLWMASKARYGLMALAP